MENLKILEKFAIVELLIGPPIPKDGRGNLPSNHCVSYKNVTLEIIGDYMFIGEDEMVDRDGEKMVATHYHKHHVGDIQSYKTYQKMGEVSEIKSLPNPKKLLTEGEQNNNK